MNMALKSLLLQVIDSMYLDRIRARLVGFVTRSTRGIFDYLYIIYGWVAPLDIRDNGLAKYNPYNAANPIKILYN